MPVLELRDGRALGYARYGAAGGRPVLYFHGLPGSRREALVMDAPARALDVALVAVDRPGYGLSDFQAGRELSGWPNDVAELTDALGMERFGVLGVSGGGPYALACAHALAPRLECAGVVCGLGPLSEPALRRSMGRFARSAFALATTSPRVLELAYGKPASLLCRQLPILTLQIIARLNGQPDRSAMLRPDMLAALSHSLEEAFVQGARGAEQDLQVLRRPWGFELRAVHSFVRLWHGDADTVVPAAHSEYLHARLPDSQLTIIPGEGHFSLPLGRCHALLEALLEPR